MQGPEAKYSKVLPGHLTIIHTKSELTLTKSNRSGQKEKNLYLAGLNVQVSCYAINSIVNCPAAIRR